MFKVIIAGGRDFNDYNLLKSKCDFYLSKINEEIEIVCGGAKGADSLGERYAKEKGLSIRYFCADWDLYGKSAGYRRNVEMGNYADALIAFWDGKSKGTKHMIDYALMKKINVRVVKYNYL